ncbi:MAG: LON peptidase substrate-binding domain-containing protein [Candidatus Sumerlaeota bacterium]|nr:LON peptidase substrate-binding domain-containing protein [Candidatus Sumerlaeota bacterium]
MEHEIFDVSLLPLPNVVFFPRTVVSLQVSEENFQTLRENGLTPNRRLALALQRGAENGCPKERRGIHKVFGVGSIVVNQKDGDGSHTVKVEGVCRAMALDDPPAEPGRAVRVEVVKDYYDHGRRGPAEHPRGIRRHPPRRSGGHPNGNHQPAPDPRKAQSRLAWRGQFCPRTTGGAECRRRQGCPRPVGVKSKLDPPMLNWLLVPAHIQTLLIALAVATPIAAWLVAASQWTSRGAQWVRRRPFWIAALCGPLVLALWGVFNAIEDRFGLDSLAALGLNAALFLSVGLGLGWWAGNKARPEKPKGNGGA